MITVTIPWPSRYLSPNSRSFWAVKAHANKMAKASALYLVREVHRGKLDAERVKVSLTFNPPDNRRRDLDNLIASLKSALDGISLALGIDDSKFELACRMGSVAKGGNVLVTIEAL